MLNQMRTRQPNDLHVPYRVFVKISPRGPIERWKLFAAIPPPPERPKGLAPGRLLGEEDFAFVGPFDGVVVSTLDLLANSRDLPSCSPPSEPACSGRSLDHA